MKTLLVLTFLTLAACGKDLTAPVDNSLPRLMGAGDGVVRFTLSANCPTTTLAFEMDQFLYGPETLSPGKSFDYVEKAGVHVTGAYSFPSKSVVFPKENVTVTVGQRAVRTLSC